MKPFQRFFRKQATWKGGLYGDEPMPTDYRVKSAGSLLKGALANIDLNSGIDEERLNAVWRGVVGGENAKYTRPLSVNKGVLRVAILQPSMKFHYQQIKRQLLRTVQHELPGEGITDLKLVVA